MQTESNVMAQLKLKCAAYAHADAATEVEKAVQRGDLPECDWREAVEEILADLPEIILEQNERRKAAQ